MKTLESEARAYYGLVKLSSGNDGFRIRVRWLGFDSAHDTWEPIAQLSTDAPDLVEQYLYAHRADRQCERYLRRYFPG